jgi:protoheme IX farnesyltransferase
MKYYYELTKSGLVFGNIVTVIAGFLLGSRTAEAVSGSLVVNGRLFVATFVGILLVMASGCVFNNYIDRDIDACMERTKRRALVAGRVSGRAAVLFASILGAAGFLILIIYTNLLATLAGLTGFVFYVFAYSLWGKRRTVYGTFIGAVAGAMPPVVGYVAASGRIDMAAVILFLIMLTWQMPHFFAIAIRRKDDYAAAKIPVMPVAYGVRRTKTSMSIYIAEFIVASSLLFIFHYAGYGYLAIALALGIAWLALGIKGFFISDGDSIAAVAANRRWARQMFFFSLIVMMAVFITIAGGAIV